MLTRSQVARRIGRSLATVRRLEGKELHPRPDARGVNRFDPGEVDALADRLMETGSVPALHDDGPPSAESDYRQDAQTITKLTADVENLQRQLDHAERKARDADHQLHAHKERVARVLGGLARELIDVDPDLGDCVLDAMRELDD